MAEWSVLIKSSDYLHLELPQLGNMMVNGGKNYREMRTFAASNTEYNVVHLPFQRDSVPCAANWFLKKWSTLIILEILCTKVGPLIKKKKKHKANIELVTFFFCWSFWFCCSHFLSCYVQQNASRMGQKAQSILFSSYSKQVHGITWGVFPFKWCLQSPGICTSCGSSQDGCYKIWQIKGNT